MICAALMKLAFNTRDSVVLLTLHGTISHLLASEVGITLPFPLPQNTESC